MTQPSPLDILSKGGGFGARPQQAFLRPRRGGKNRKRYTLALLAGSAPPENVFTVLTISTVETIIVTGDEDEYKYSLCSVNTYPDFNRTK